MYMIYKNMIPFLLEEILKNIGNSNKTIGLYNKTYKLMFNSYNKNTEYVVYNEIRLLTSIGNIVCIERQMIFIQFQLYFIKTLMMDIQWNLYNLNMSICSLSWDPVQVVSRWNEKVIFYNRKLPEFQLPYNWRFLEFLRYIKQGEKGLNLLDYARYEGKVYIIPKLVELSYFHESERREVHYDDPYLKLPLLEVLKD